MERYKLGCGAVIYKEENDIVPSENSVVFNVQVFKESSGKYYTSFRLILEKYTKVQIDSMQRGGTEDEKDFCYHLISDLVGFLRYDRPFYKEFALVVNCDSFFPMMIKAVSE